MNILKLAAVAVFGMVGTAAMAAPAVMVQAKDCSIISGGAGFGTCTETHNQAGLFTKYTDEVTDLHPYLATPPLHTDTFSGFEWFSDSPTTSAEVSYFVSTSPKVLWIDHFVLWNEEISGIGVFNLWFGATAGAHDDLVLSAISPFDNPVGVYGPEFWEFKPRPTTGWWSLEMSRCPQTDPGSFSSCAVGEVAFGGYAVPEPATWAMLIVGFGLVGFAMRRKGVAVVSA